MSVHTLPRPQAAVPVVELYWQAERAPRPETALRALTALELMYAYWGSDRD